ncbi:hypothetical protein ABIB27_003340 [Arthrobacter sp. UYEF21]
MAPGVAQPIQGILRSERTVCEPGRPAFHLAQALIPGGPERRCGSGASLPVTFAEEGPVFLQDAAAVTGAFRDGAGIQFRDGWPPM